MELLKKMSLTLTLVLTSVAAQATWYNLDYKNQEFPQGATIHLLSDLQEKYPGVVQNADVKEVKIWATSLNPNTSISLDLGVWQSDARRLSTGRRTTLMDFHVPAEVAREGDWAVFLQGDIALQEISVDLQTGYTEPHDPLNP